MVTMISPMSFAFFFFNDTATTEIYTLSLHDALPICQTAAAQRSCHADQDPRAADFLWRRAAAAGRSEEHTSELQSLAYLVCRLLLEKKNKKTSYNNYYRTNPNT